jgi:hypothetical protein
MRDFMDCRHCGEEQDQTEAREWHSLGHSDDVDTECDHCGKSIRVTATMCYEVSEIED